LGVFYPDQELSEAWQKTSHYLTAVQKSCLADDLSVMFDVREGDVASEIVSVAQRTNAGLIIMSSHGYSGMDRWVMGSVTEKVLHAAPCPVWVVRTLVAPRHVLITLDGSELAEKVLPAAIEIARSFDALITLLRVVPELTAEDVSSLEANMAGLSRHYSDELLTEANDYLVRVAGRFEDGPADIQTAVRFGSAAETILDYTDRHGVDLVAMTTHGRTGLRRWLYGSVTQKVLDQLSISTLVARSNADDLA
jgi:nucleotide-binding universal stress UspA family protein